MSKMPRIVAIVSIVAGAILIVAGVVTYYIVHRELAGYRLGDVMAQLHAIPPRRMALATIATALSYVVLTGYDLLALRWIGSRIGSLRIAVASFVAYAFSNNVGLSFLGGSAASSGALALASTWLGGLSNGAHPSIVVSESREHQDMIYAPVPEPETYTLFIAGLAAMAFVARRRRA